MQKLVEVVWNRELLARGKCATPPLSAGCVTGLLQSLSTWIRRLDVLRQAHHLFRARFSKDRSSCGK
jgi:hypothetical protein